MPDLKRDVGPLGEAVLNQWAAQEGLAAISSAARDVGGWDYLLTWPLRTSASTSTADGMRLSALPLDRQPGSLSCFVQVKATDVRRKKSWSVKVTNWLQLVRVPVPAFFLVLEFDGTPHCQRAHLVHLDGTHIRAVLKRVRELESRGKAGRLHQYRDSLTWTKAHALGSLDGAGLRTRIEAVVGPDIDAYVAAKAQLRQTVGYERGRKRLSGRVHAPAQWKGDPRELLLDFMLGLVRHLEVTDVELRDTRFGIDAPEPELRAASALLGSDGVPPYGPARLRFALRAPAMPAGEPVSSGEFGRAAGGGCEATIGGATSSIAGSQTVAGDEVDLTGEARVVWDPEVEGRGRARLSVPCLDLVLSLPEGSAKLELRPPRAREERPLADLRGVADLIVLAVNANDRGCEVTVSPRVNGEPLGRSSTVVGFGARATPLRGWAELIRLASRVARHLGLPPTVAVSAHALAREEGSLWFLDALYRPAALNVRWEATATTLGEPPEGLWCMVVAVSARIGTYVVQVGAALVGRPTSMTPTPEGFTRVVVDAPEVRFHAQRVYQSSEQPETSDRELHDNIMRRYAPEMSVVSGTPDGDGAVPDFHDGQVIRREGPRPTLIRGDSQI